LDNGEKKKKRLQIGLFECDVVEEKISSHLSNFSDATRRTLSAAASVNPQRAFYTSFYLFKYSTASNVNNQYLIILFISIYLFFL